jgi:hypothetical protein
VLPEAAPVLLGFALVVVVVLVHVAALWVRRPRSGEAWTSAYVLASLLTIISATYIAFLLASLTFIDAANVPDTRLLAPVFCWLATAIVAAAADAHRAGRLARSWRYAGWGLAGVVVLTQLVRAVPFIREGRAEGLAYRRVALDRSAAVSYLRSLPPDVPVYSNSARFIYFITGRLVRELPLVYNPLTRTDDGRFDRKIANIARGLRARGGRVVYFTGQDPVYRPSADRIARVVPLKLELGDSLSSVFSIP